jgi:hypothetical protein
VTLTQSTQDSTARTAGSPALSRGQRCCLLLALLRGCVTKCYFSSLVLDWMERSACTQFSRLDALRESCGTGWRRRRGYFDFLFLVKKTFHKKVEQFLQSITSDT